MTAITTSSSTTSGGCFGGMTSASGNSCIHGIVGPCYQCNGYASIPNSAGVNVGYCTCNQVTTFPCPLHSYTYTAPSFTTWPPTPTLPVVDLCKEGHRVTHELISDAKGLRIDFKCTFCKGCVIYSKYLVRLPKYLRTEKCLNKILNPE